MVQRFRAVSLASLPKAIIVAGGGPYPGNTLWPHTQASANYAYRALVHQGFTKDTIAYYSADTGLDLDANGVADDVDGDVTAANLEQAITTWAAEPVDAVPVRRARASVKLAQPIELARDLGVERLAGRVLASGQEARPIEKVARIDADHRRRVPAGRRRSRPRDEPAQRSLPSVPSRDRGEISLQQAFLAHC